MKYVSCTKQNASQFLPLSHHLAVILSSNIEQANKSTYLTSTELKVKSFLSHYSIQIIWIIETNSDWTRLLKYRNQLIFNTYNYFIYLLARNSLVFVYLLLIKFKIELTSYKLPQITKKDFIAFLSACWVQTSFILIISFYQKWLLGYHMSSYLTASKYYLHLFLWARLWSKQINPLPFS